MTPEDKKFAKAYLDAAVKFARRKVKTPTSHALYPHHYADDWIRDLLEEVLHEQPGQVATSACTCRGGPHGGYTCPECRGGR